MNFKIDTKRPSATDRAVMDFLRRYWGILIDQVPMAEVERKAELAYIERATGTNHQRIRRMWDELDAVTTRENDKLWPRLWRRRRPEGEGSDTEIS